MADTRNLWAIIVEELKSQGLTISAMESCTGGGIAYHITQISGASEVFKGSIVAYSNDIKTQCGVPEDIINTYTVYSKETSIEMAKAAKRFAKSNIGIGVTGQFGRQDPNNPTSAVNRVWYAIVTDSEIYSDYIDVPEKERCEQQEYAILKIAKAISSIL